MKRPRLYRVRQPVATFTSLVEAAQGEGLRVGWLALREPPPTSDWLPAAGTGIAQSVCAGAIHTASFRVRKGPPVLDDLLRQHFLGCDLVLVDGEAALPTLAAEARSWIVETVDGERRSYETGELLALVARAPRATGGY